MSVGPVPELLVSRRDRPGARRWHVEAGAPVRGEAWTDLVSGAMRVPFDGGAHGRLVRAHELMHARVSPWSPTCFTSFAPLEARTVECAEEFRVNQLLSRVGFDLAELRDGSERLTGERLCTAGEHAELVRFAAALAGTPALADLLRGARRVDPAIAAMCRALERDLLRVVRRVSTSSLAATSSIEGVPTGFAVHTRAIAERIDAHLRSGCSAGRGRRRGRPTATGVFAPLILDRAVVLDRHVAGVRSPRRVPAATGPRLVRPSRLALDPQRRAFPPGGSWAGRGGRGRPVRLDVAPRGRPPGAARPRAGGVCVGYSHAPGSAEVPNAWVLADRGRAAGTVRQGNVGNGVDGPALRYALARRRPGEPVVWVCDGQVTDSGDHADAGLAAACARLVLRHRIQMVATVPEGLAVLRTRAMGRPATAPRAGGGGRHTPPVELPVDPNRRSRSTGGEQVFGPRRSGRDDMAIAPLEQPARDPRIDREGLRLIPAAGLRLLLRGAPRSTLGQRSWSARGATTRRPPRGPRRPTPSTARRPERFDRAAGPARRGPCAR